MQQTNEVKPTEAYSAEVVQWRRQLASVESKIAKLSLEGENLRRKIREAKERAALGPYIGREVTITRGQDRGRLPAGPIILIEVKRTKALVEILGKRWRLPIDWLQEASPGSFFVSL